MSSALINKAAQALTKAFDELSAVLSELQDNAKSQDWSQVDDLEINIWNIVEDIEYTLHELTQPFKNEIPATAVDPESI